MYFKKKTYSNDMEVLDTEKNLVTKTITINSTDVTADADGNKYVVSGKLIDADGKVVTQGGSPGSETLSATPVGIMYKTVNVKNGDEPAAVIIEGYVRADRVLSGFADAAVTAIKTALPEIKFV